MVGQAGVIASGNATVVVARVACLSSSFTKPVDASRLWRPGKRLLNAGNGRVIAAPSPSNDGARRQAKLQAVPSDISSAQAIFAPPPLESSSRLLRSSNLCAALPDASPNNKMVEVKPDWAIQLEEKIVDLQKSQADLEMRMSLLRIFTIGSMTLKR